MEVEKFEKRLANLHDKTEYGIHMRNLKQALNHGLIFKQVSRVFKFNQNALLATDVNGSTDLRKKAKSDFEKEFFKLMNNGVFGKTMKKCEKT